MLTGYVLLDLETTGGNALTSRITEIAAVRFDRGVEVARCSKLVNPDCSIPFFIQKLTGISDQLVEDAPSFKQVSDELLASKRCAPCAACARGHWHEAQCTGL